MNKIKDFLLKILKHPKFKTFLWQTANGLLTVIIFALADVNWVYAPMIVAGLNWLTKYINTTYLK